MCLEEQERQTRADVVPGAACSWEILHAHSQDTSVVLFGDLSYVVIWWGRGGCLVSIKLRWDAGIG